MSKIELQLNLKQVDPKKGKSLLYRLELDDFLAELAHLYERTLGVECIPTVMLKEECSVEVVVNDIKHKELTLLNDYTKNLLSSLLFEEVDVFQASIENERLYTQSPSHNTIEISSQLALEMNVEINSYVRVHCISTRNTITCLVKMNPKLAENTVLVCESLSSKLVGRVYLTKEENVCFDTVMVQDDYKIQSGFITISEKYKPFVEKYSYFTLVNKVTSSSLDLKNHQVRFDKHLKDNEIRIPYFGKMVLEVELPYKLQKEHVELFKQVLGKVNPVDRNLIEEYYGNDREMSLEILEKEKDVAATKATLHTALMQAGYLQLALYPNKECIGERKKSVLTKYKTKLLDRWIGTRRMPLKVVRAYETDERGEIVRLTKSTMDILGVEANDTLRIYYRGKCIKVKVLLVDDLKAMSHANILQSYSELNNTIAMNGYMCQRLGVHSPNVAVEVERDMDFLFKKKLSSYVLMIIGLLIVLGQYSFPIYVFVGLMVVGSIWCIYASLSNERARIKS